MSIRRTSPLFTFFLFILCIISSSVYAPTSTDLTHWNTNFLPTISQKTFLGTIQFPQTITHAPMLPPLFYKGQEIDIELSLASIPKKGAYKILENPDHPELYFLITENLSFPKNSEIIALETSAHHSYKFFKLTMKPKKILSENNNTKSSEKLVFTWTIHELDNSKPVIQVPDNCIIFFMNPRFITLQAEQWEPTDTVFKLPTLVFDETIDEQTLQVTATKIMLSSVLDFRVLHTKTKSIKKSAHNRILEMPSNKNKYIS